MLKGFFCHDVAGSGRSSYTAVDLTLSELDIGCDEKAM